MKKLIKELLWLLTIGGSVTGGIFLFVGIDEAQSAVQEASIAAISVGMAVIPYCLAKAYSEFIEL